MNCGGALRSSHVLLFYFLPFLCPFLSPAFFSSSFFSYVAVFVVRRSRAIQALVVGRCRDACKYVARGANSGGIVILMSRTRLVRNGAAGRLRVPVSGRPSVEDREPCLERRKFHPTPVSVLSRHGLAAARKAIGAAFLFCFSASFLTFRFSLGSFRCRFRPTSSVRAENKTVPGLARTH